MDVIQIEGGHRVTGEVRVEGAKNSALKLMAATIMAPGVTTLTNVPNIADVHVMGKVLKNIGATIEVVNEHELKIDTSTVDSWETPYHLVAQMRASTAVLGPLLSRFGKAVVAMPGGCNIGARKIDMHILGLEALGVEFKVDHGNIHASAPHGLKGETVTLSFASVGATENLMMASDQRCRLSRHRNRGGLRAPPGHAQGRGRPHRGRDLPGHRRPHRRSRDRSRV